MKIEFLDDLTDGGKYPDADPEQLIRLYSFDLTEAIKFRDRLQTRIIDEQSVLNLSLESFIEAINCNLIFRISEIDIGVSAIENENFYCDLSLVAYKKMMDLLEPFCDPKNNEIYKWSSYQWLYDLDNPIDLLLSPGGSW